MHKNVNQILFVWKIFVLTFYCVSSLVECASISVQLQVGNEFHLHYLFVCVSVTVAGPVPPGYRRKR